MTLPNYYHTLGLEFGASDEEIKFAYRKLSKKFHPDMNEGDKFFEQRFKEIQIAYETLSDTLKKERYLDDYKNQYYGNKTANDFQQKDDSKKQSTYSSKQSSTVNPNYPRPDESKRKFNYNWLLITLLILGVFALVKSSIQKSIRKKEDQQALNNYSSASVPSSTTTYNSEYPSETLPSNNYYTTTDTTIVVPSSSTTTANNENAQTDGSLIEAESTSTVDNNGASKAETERWILMKLKQYSKEKIDCPDRHYEYYPGPCTHYFDYQFSFDENNLVIRYNYDSIRYDIAKIPIYDFDKIYDKYSKISFFNKHNTVIDINTNTNEQSVYSVFTIGFKTNAETDLPKRIEEAMIHLKKYYSKPNTNEPF